jgi:UTP--glucose-1-phosphate uridylyltransferase
VVRQSVGLLVGSYRRRALRRTSVPAMVKPSVAPEGAMDPSGMTAGITKAVIPAAGLGTRFLPATKATPKEMLPVVDKPAIQYVVEEAVAAGLTDVLMITGRNKRPLEDHFDRAYELEQALEAKGDKTRLKTVRESSELAAVHYVRQGDPRGLGHAVLCAQQHVGNQPFAVLLGDDLIDPRDLLLSRMIDVQARLGGSVVALIEVEPEQIELYGCAAVEETSQADVVRVTDLVEKPPAAKAPSRLAIIGRYVLDSAVFDVLGRTAPGRGGEIQLTDAMRELAATGSPMHGVLFRGRRYDTGDRSDYLKAIVRLACEREDLGPEFLAWLRGFVAARPASESVRQDEGLADAEVVW